jgi:Family of unknown function (DUF6221)
MDLAEFLAARLDEDERLARQALDEPAPEDGRDIRYPYPGRLARAMHDARHGPARVLREVAARRAILAEHAATDWTAYGDRMCRRCVLDDDEPHDEPYHWLPFPCPTLRALAAAYSDHPDYDPAWAPAVTGQRGR